MPTYVYRCEKCGHSFEEVQSIKDEPLTDCVYIDPEGPCDGRVRRVVQPVGVAYKGTGFHSTDYGKHGRNSPSYKDYVS